MTTRRAFLRELGITALAVPLAAIAQQPPAKVARIGFLGAATPAGFASRINAMKDGLRELGYIEGRNLLIEYRWTNDDATRLDELAADLARSKVDIIVTGGTPAIQAAKRATSTIPIVMGASGDAAATGLVQSLARPGGNVTGSTFSEPELAAKRIELLKEVMPRLSEVAYLVNTDIILYAEYVLPEVAKRGSAVKIRARIFPVRNPDELHSAFAAISKTGIEAVTVGNGPPLVSRLPVIAELALKRKLLSSGAAEYGGAGGAVGYGQDVPALYRRAAYFVDRILKGARPSELPVEQPTKYDLVINMKTAKAIGIAIPQGLLVRADKVIE